MNAELCTKLQQRRSGGTRNLLGLLVYPTPVVRRVKRWVRWEAKRPGPAVKVEEVGLEAGTSAGAEGAAGRITAEAWVRCGETPAWMRASECCVLCKAPTKR
jgi:hypothetical protein